MKTESAIRPVTWIVAGALAVFALLAALTSDSRVVAWVNTQVSHPWKHAAAVISRIGDWPAHVAAGVVGLLVAALTHRKDWVRIFLAMLLACALAGLGARVIKIATGRARPSIKSEAAWNGPSLSAQDNAFPSGHTASSTAFFVALFLKRRKISTPLLLVPALIATARVLAGAHYLSDVIFAAGLGIVCALLCTRWVVSDHAPAKLAR